MNLERRKASLEDIDTVKSILDQAGTIPASKNIDQWPASFDPVIIEKYIARNGVYLYSLDDHFVGTVDLRDQDPDTWPEDDTKSLYAHRLAIDPAYSGQGIGKQIIMDVIDQGAIEGYDYIRLDCVSHNKQLRNYYEKLGFEHIQDVTVHDIDTSLYQLKLM